jgi:hypothetical protein
MGRRRHRNQHRRGRSKKRMKMPGFHGGKGKDKKKVDPLLPAQFRGSYNMCSHYRVPVMVGDWVVLCSASKSIPKEEIFPDAGIYLERDWLRERGSMAVSPGTLWPGIKPWFPAIYADWPDFGTFPIQNVHMMVDWAIIQLEALKILEIGCHGAHGRTGTLLACMIAEMEGKSAQDAIDAARDRLCDKCIETLKQEDLVFEFTGEEPPERASKWGFKGPWKNPWEKGEKWWEKPGAFDSNVQDEVVDHLTELHGDDTEPLELGAPCGEEICDHLCMHARSEYSDGRLYCSYLCRAVVNGV